MIEVLDARNRILGVEHPDTITAMENLATMYGNLEKHAEAEKLEIQVLNARNKIIEVKHPGTIMAIANLAATCRNLGKHTGGEELQIQGQQAQSRALGGEHPDKTKTMSNVEQAQETQVLDGRSTVYEEETSNSIQVLLNPPGAAILPDTIINSEKKVHGPSNLAKRLSKFKSRITYLFHKKEHLDVGGFGGISS
ncbi:hypothetical protein K443DRAFT_9810 [Laccaria amethystina LaAM-08-1]|uniref:Kinesin light chain n=1 Tax=Laccaria amethystina LaAM-08-1 TaxID=1095629 RepID=A0A0C9WXR6_9AGAR|nr:hypothetical protein K443DRAFT_9810 [Laccaria amethystina LaAM-08-1]